MRWMLLSDLDGYLYNSVRVKRIPCFVDLRCSGYNSSGISLKARREMVTYEGCSLLRSVTHSMSPVGTSHDWTALIRASGSLDAVVFDRKCAYHVLGLLLWLVESDGTVRVR